MVVPGRIAGPPSGGTGNGPFTIPVNRTLSMIVCRSREEPPFGQGEFGHGMGKCQHPVDLAIAAPGPGEEIELAHPAAGRATGAERMAASGTRRRRWRGVAPAQEFGAARLGPGGLLRLAPLH